MAKIHPPHDRPLSQKDPLRQPTMLAILWLTFVGVWGGVLWLLWGQLPSTLQMPLKAEPEKPIPGYLMARMEPSFAKAWVDGKPWSWRAGGISLLPGNYRLEVRAIGHHPHTRQVRVHAEDATLVRVVLDPFPVPVSITSLPSGAQVFLNGRLQGKTPLHLQLKPRAYHLRLTKDPLGAVEQDILVVARPKKPQAWSFPLGGARKRAVDGGERRWVSKGVFSRGLSEKAMQKVYDLCSLFRKDCRKEWWSAEQPERLIEMSGFWIDHLEVSRDRYAICVKAGRCTPLRFVRKDPNLPAFGVSWQQAKAYCRYAGGRLPTEAEWEYAARGKDGRLFVWGKAWKKAWANHGIFLAGRKTTGPWEGDGALFAAKVGSFPHDRSVFGVRDLVGNVAEWVADCYHASFFRVAAEKDPSHEPEKCEMRVIRGGDWASAPWDLRVTARKPALPQLQSLSVGFRCVEASSSQAPAP
ncbi:MAG: SUMF1/EgtB/PvdO family nonheme iron enzyme [Myxococcales bacterium]|nr:SUMF1/EgtB/PvdO family nonheme iron enzyme [Myxococcales bacterium]